MNKVNILCIGDIVGKPGRDCLAMHLNQVRKENNIHFTIANVENSAGGFGFNKKIYDEFTSFGINAFTSGNHIYQQKDILTYFEQLNNLLRPLNFPAGNPGKGFKIFNFNNIKIAVVNLIGRVFIGEYDCPFQALKKIIPEIKKETPIILADIHAEATSEKNALGYFLDGEASVVFGTHTHVLTHDERILESGTGYITDIGMVGAYESIIGMKKEPIINKFITQMPHRFEVPKTNQFIFNGMACTIDTKTGKCIDIKVIRKILTK